MPWLPTIGGTADASASALQEADVDKPHRALGLQGRSLSHLAWRMANGAGNAAMIR